jgi:SNF2 family DNA or RNA helicase
MIYIHNTMISSHCSYYSLVDAEACFAVAQFLTHPDAQKARQTIVHHWATPQWQRELDRILTNDPKDDEPLLRDGEWLGWLVEDEGHWWTYKALPIAVRNKKTGKGITSRKISANLLRKKSLDLDSKERELAMIWLAFNSKESRNYTDPESLAKLIQIAHAYKSLYIKSASSIELAQITNHQITVELHDDPPSLQLALNHQPLDKKLAEIVTSLQGPDFIIQRGLGSQLQIIEIPAPVIRLVQRARSTSLTLHKNATPFFKEKKQELSQKPGVSLAPSLRGTHVPPQRHLVAKLQPLPQGGLSLSILAQPLPGAPSVTPGQPPSTLHAITDHDDLYTERDLDAELLHVQQLTEQLHLTDRLDADLSLSLDSPDDAAELLEPLKLYASQPNSDLSLQWTSQRPISYSRNSSSSQLKLAIKPVERFFKVTGALHIDEHSSIPLEQLLLAARENKKWIQLNEETWVEIEASLNKHLQQLAHSINTKKSTLDPLAATSLIQLQEHGAQLKADTKWLTHVKKIQDAQKLEPKTPKSLKATLRSYQLDGYQWLARLATWAPGAILADDMGLGKTVQALTLLLSRSKQGPQLVIAPASVCTNWSREAATFAPSLNVHLIRSGAQLEDSPIPAPNDLFILGYDLLARHVESFKDVTWQTAVFDEAQAFKNSDTQRFAAIQALNADFRLALTGTPVENHTGELWSIVSSTVTGLLGKESHFTKTFRAPIERDQSASAQHALAQLISPFVLRRLKRDVAQELPPRTDIRLDIELSADERRRYETFRRATIATLEDTNQNNEAPEQNKRFAILAALTRLRQLANHVRLVEPKSKIESSKLNILREHLLELKEQGHRALVFSQFVSLLELVRDDLTSAGLDVVMLDGSMTQKKRQLAVDAFQDNQHDVFLLSIKAGGVGLNLTAANFVFILDPWWNPAVEDQATDRAHRIGQDQPVTVYRLIAQDTVEEIIYTMHQQKRELMDSLLSESGSSRALSLEELSSLINHSSSPD